MSKKLIISLSAVGAAIAVVLILFWTLFALSSVSVEFHSTTQNLTVSEEEIVNAGQFNYGACVFFEGKNKSIEKINEKVAENPNFAYLKVVNIETRFPNKFVIHVTEREELFAVEHAGQTLICDRDFRVLRKTEDFESTQSNAVLLSGLSISNEAVAVGDFLDIEQVVMKKFLSAMLQNNRSIAEILGKFEKVELSKYQDEMAKVEYTSMKLSTFAGRKFVVNNIDFYLAEKFQKMFAVESSLYNQNVDSNGNILKSNGEINYVVKTEDGEYISYDIAKDMVDENDHHIYDEGDKVALTYAILARCYIKIANHTLSEYVERDARDIFYALVEYL